MNKNFALIIISIVLAVCLFVGVRETRDTIILIEPDYILCKKFGKIDIDSESYQILKDLKPNESATVKKVNSNCYIVKINESE